MSSPYHNLPVPPTTEIERQLPSLPSLPAQISPRPSKDELPTHRAYMSTTASESRSTVYSSSSQFSSAPILRSGAEDAALLGSDDPFWSRLDTSAQRQKDSENGVWLEKSQGKSSRHIRVLWVVGFILLLAAIGGIAAGVYFANKASSNNARPDALGGASNVGFTQKAPVAAPSSTNVADTEETATETSRHVSPTNVLDD